MVAQFGGALLIARLTVYWALRRYKSEKLWDKKILAAADLQASLRTMNVIADRLYRDSIDETELTEAAISRLIDDWNAAERRLRETAGIAAVLFPGEVKSEIAKLETGLAERSDSNQEAWENQSIGVQQALEFFEKGPISFSINSNGRFQLCADRSHRERSARAEVKLRIEALAYARSQVDNRQSHLA